MASRYFGIDRGEPKEAITESGSATGKDLELVIDEAAIVNLDEITVLVKKVLAFLQEDKRYA